jgi:isopenicillin-N epimerase
VSHGANDDRRDRSRFRLTFDWTGTADPTPVLSIPAAIRYVGGLHPDGWPGLMAANAALALLGRDRLCAALSIPTPAPDSMLGSMAAVPLPGLAPSRSAAMRLAAELFDQERIEVPVFAFPVPAALPPGGTPALAILRISAQRYNRAEEYDALAAIVARRLRAPSSPRSLLGRLRHG